MSWAAHAEQSQPRAQAPYMEQVEGAPARDLPRVPASCNPWGHNPTW